MLDFTFCTYIILSLFNFIFDKNKNVWVIVFIYFIIKQFISYHDPVQYITTEYILQITMLSICAILFSHNYKDIRCIICIALIIVSFINVFIYLYPAVSTDAFSIFYNLSDRIYYEIILILAVYSENNKTIQNILTTSISILLMLTYIF